MLLPLQIFSHWLWPGCKYRYNRSLIRYPSPEKQMIIRKKLDNNVGILKLFPGIRREFVESILNTPGLRGLILETYGSGNAPSYEWLKNALKQFVDNGGTVINVTQCQTGFVEMGLYKTSIGLKEAGVFSGRDITTEAALTKLMLLLGSASSKEKVAERLCKSMCGEIS